MNDTLIQIAFAGAGALLGLVYYWKVGCRTGFCPLISTRAGSVIFGAMLGFLISGYVL